MLQKLSRDYADWSHHISEGYLVVLKGQDVIRISPGRTAFIGSRLRVFENRILERIFGPKKKN
jgi:hypothetical protein